MRIIDAVAASVALLAIVIAAAVIARQRYMLRVGGAVPVAIRTGGHRWTYGVARFVDAEFRWYRAVGVGTRASRVMDRTRLQIVERRSPTPDEFGSLPSSAVVVDCRELEHIVTMAFSDSAFTGFLSWLEASAPHL